MELTLLEIHYKLRIEALQDDPNVNYGKRLVVTEMLAAEHGWKWKCPMEYIAARTQNIYNA